jgi:hypothetical protein
MEEIINTKANLWDRRNEIEINQHKQTMTF